MQKGMDTQNMDITDKALLFVKDMYKKKFGTLDTFDENYLIYLKLPTFKACENIHEKLTNYNQETDSLLDIENEYLEGESFPVKLH